MKSKIVESQADLYRFYPLPGNLITELKRDRIEITKEMSIQDILAQKIQREKMIAEKLGEPVVDTQEQDLPEPYFSLYKIKHALTDNKLYAADIASFNDIHEQMAWVDLDFQKELYKKSKSSGQYKGTWVQFEIASKKLSKINNGYFQHDWAKAYLNYGVVCFCRTWNNQLMWGHYANGHYGVCIAYQISKELKETFSIPESRIYQYLTEAVYKYSVLFGRVTCGENPRVWDCELKKQVDQTYDELCKEQLELSRLIGQGDYMAIFSNMFFKSNAWKDEAEQRMIFVGKSGSIPIEQLVPGRGKEPYIKISEVICGNKVDNEIITLLKNSRTPKNLPFKKAQPKGGTFECELINF